MNDNTSIGPTIFGLIAIVAIAFAMFHDDRPHLSRDPSHLSE